MIKFFFSETVPGPVGIMKVLYDGSSTESWESRQYEKKDSFTVHSRRLAKLDRFRKKKK